MCCGVSKDRERAQCPMLCTWVWWKLLTWAPMFCAFLSADWQGNTSLAHGAAVWVGVCPFKGPGCPRGAGLWRAVARSCLAVCVWAAGAGPAWLWALLRARQRAGSTRTASSEGGHSWCAACHTACRSCSARDLQLGQTCTDSWGNSRKPILNINIAQPFATVSNLSFKASSNLGF